MKQLKNSQQPDTGKETTKKPVSKEGAVEKKQSYWLVIILFLVLLAVIGGGGFWGWQQILQHQKKSQASISELQAQLLQRATRAQLDDSILPLQQSVGRTDGRLSTLETGLQGLTASTEKLYELYGRDENGWKLAEVEYLMSIAQHKLILENDFEGAAKTLTAASDRIAELADPGLLSVRVEINDEIARLKTRARPDLVGMTLLVSRLTRQIIHLKPGYQTRVVDEEVPQSAEPVTEDPNRSYDQMLKDFVTSLVTINTSKPKVEQVEQAAIVNVTEKLEDNLKLTRWSVLERDAFQYDRLMTENINLFKQYYDLEKAANADFYSSLLQLQKSTLKPELPDISGSLRSLREIQKKRENIPQQAVQQETDNG